MLQRRRRRRLRKASGSHRATAARDKITVAESKVLAKLSIYRSVHRYVERLTTIDDRDMLPLLVTTTGVDIKRCYPCKLAGLVDSN